MRKTMCVLLLSVCFLGCGGCTLLDNLLARLGGVDVTVCAPGVDECWEWSR